MKTHLFAPAIALGLGLSIAHFALALDGDKDRDAALFTAARYIEHDKFLASDELEGRRPGTPGIEQAATYISYQFMTYGLKPAGENGTYYQPFEVRGGKTLKRSECSLDFDGLDGEWQLGKDWTPMPFSAVGNVSGPLAFAGYGIEYTPEPPASQPTDSAPAVKDEPYNDYDGFDPAGKVLLIFRHEPRAADPAAKFGGKEPSPKSLFVNKANLAADKGAKALIVVNPPDRDADGDGKPDADELYAWSDQERGTYRLPIIHVTQAVAAKLLEKAGLPDLKTLQAKLDKDRKPASADMPGLSANFKTGVHFIEARNVIGLLEGSERPDEYIVIGAHYDHLGKSTPWGGDDRTPQIHNGADDNASGTSGVLELARVIAAGPRPKRSILFMTFSAEEMGLLGSAHYVKHPTVPLSQIKAMINLDMIGRFAQDEFEIYGIPSAKEFPELVAGLAKEYDVKYKAPKNNDRFFGASDHASFYYKGIPVLFAFTGVHPQYHKPDDDWQLIDAEGAAKLLTMFHRIAVTVANMDAGPTKPTAEEEKELEKQAAPPKNAAEKADEAAKKSAQGEQAAKSDKPAEERGGERASRMPRVRMRIELDYGDNGNGVLVKRVMAGGPAEKAGLKDGDRIIKVGAKDVADIETYMSSMKDVKPGDEIEMVAKRGNENVTVKVKFDSAPNRDPK